MKNKLLIPYVKGLADGADRAMHTDAKLMKTPSVEPDVGMFLECFTSTFNPSNILEIGCGIGVSTRYMEKGAPDAQITAVDYNRGRLDYAEENINSEKVSFVYSDGIDFLINTKSEYDLIFIDSVKKQYPVMLYYALKRLKEGGVIVFDDIFMYGEVFCEDCEIADKYRPAVRILREFIERVKIEHRHCLLPIGSGVMMIYGDK